MDLLEKYGIDEEHYVHVNSWEEAKDMIDFFISEGSEYVTVDEVNFSSYPFFYIDDNKYRFQGNVTFDGPHGRSEVDDIGSVMEFEEWAQNYLPGYFQETCNFEEADIVGLL